MDFTKQVLKWHETYCRDLLWRRFLCKNPVSFIFIKNFFSEKVRHFAKNGINSYTHGNNA